MDTRSARLLFLGISLAVIVFIAITILGNSSDTIKRINSYIVLFMFVLIALLLYVAWRAVIKVAPQQTTINTTEILEQIRTQLGGVDNAATRLARIIEEKRGRVLNIPTVAFHYAEKQQITNFYNDYFKEPTLASLVSEKTGELSGELKGSIPKILESNLGSKDIEKWVSTIKLPDISLNGMFLRYQRETVRSGQVTLGLEEVDIELSELVAFDEAIENLKQRFDFEVEESVLNKHRAQLKERAAARTLTKLEQATGWILIEGRFQIQRQDGLFRFIYKHPVTEYLSAQASPILISVSIPEDSLEPGFKANYARSIGKLIPLKIYGEVFLPVNIKNGDTEMELTPLAIY